MSTARVISIMSRKGGVGKSTVSILLATTLAVSAKRKVVLLDCDNQQTVSDTRKLEQQAFGTDTPPPYEVIPLAPTFVHTFLQANASNYDIIFIDMPRMTDDSQDSATVQMLTFCDSILIPVLAGRADAMSLQALIKALKRISNFKEEHNFPFEYYGFMNKSNRRSENEQTRKYMEKMELPMFDHTLKDLKVFLNPSTYECFLNNAKTRQRYEPFYKEFVEKFYL